MRLGRHQYQQKEQVQICDFAISVGFENGDLLFIASYAGTFDRTEIWLSLYWLS